jgi:hypoxanthine phosphoribosyltransferase
MDFRNYQDFNYMNALCFHSMNRIPNDIDLIVCIPRSGLIFGTLIGEYKSLPTISLFEFLSGVNTFKIRGASRSPLFEKQPKHILLFDDAMGLGESMQTAKTKILEKFPDLKITTCVMFVEPYSVNKVDIAFKVFKDQLLPWNIMKRGIGCGCVDMDGFLCVDPTSNDTKTEEAYLNFIKNAKQKYVPDHKIKYIVSGRLEKYRKETEEWLKCHNIQYENLILCPAKNNEERRKMTPEKYKADFYKKSKCLIFIESNYGEAKAIAKMTNMPVYCTDVCELL